MIEHRSSLTLPPLTGPFAVGRSVADWKEADGELLIWTWYPAAKGARGSNEYLPAATRAAVRKSRLGLFNFLTRDFANVHGNAVWNAPRLPQAFPIVIMRGGGSSPVWNYTALAEDLASHGYVVVGIDAAELTGIVVFPDGRIVRQSPEDNPESCVQRTGQPDTVCAERFLSAWTAHIQFVVNRLGATAVGIFGHSFGGAQALQFCHDDARCKAGVDIDGAPLGSAVRDGVRQPFEFLLSDHRGEAGSEKIMADLHSIYDRLPANQRRLVVIRPSNHFTFSDDGALLKSRIFRWLLRVDGIRQLAITRGELHGFFDSYLTTPSAPVAPPPHSTAASSRSSRR